MIEILAMFQDETSAEKVYYGLELCTEKQKTKAKNYFSEHFNIILYNNKKS